MKITVSNADRTKANKLNKTKEDRLGATNDCPICFAIKRKVKDKNVHVEFKHVEVDYVRQPLPAKAEQAQRTWVKTGKMPALSFELQHDKT